MTSRMAFSYPHVFRSLSIVAGSYYDCMFTCNKWLTLQEKDLLDHHPPTQIFQGATDPIVFPSSNVGKWKFLKPPFNLIR